MSRTLRSMVHCTCISNIKRAKPSSDNTSMPVDQKKKRLHNNNNNTSTNTSLSLPMAKKDCIDTFTCWSSGDQVDFICHLLSKISHFQQSQINDFLEPLLKRDFIVALQSKSTSYCCLYLKTGLFFLLAIELSS
ncbi:unnamed protein product [Trichobilharzia regenti]|nr:unnamed protein product [Trichobilharzia regenti]